MKLTTTLSMLLAMAFCLSICACGSAGTDREQQLQSLATLPRGTAPQPEDPAPTDNPIEAPTETSTEAPTEAPTEDPTEAPTEDSTEAPTEDSTEPTEGEARDYVLNMNSKKFHLPTCSSVSKIKSSNRKDFHGTREEVIRMGYEPCKNCNP